MYSKNEVPVTQISVGTKGGGGESRTTDQLLGYVVTRMLPFLAGLLVIWLALSLTDFYYVHAWASAHFATIAQAFASHGIIGLHGAPIENFEPLTTQPDNYLHWPPLFFYVLSLVAQAFPDSIRAMHLFMAVVAIGNAWAMWMIASMFFRQRAAIVCGCAFLLMPATIRYGLVLLPANLGVLGVSVTLLFLLRYLQGSDDGRGRPLDLGLSAVAFFLSCFVSWEPFLALPGLLLAYVWSRQPELLKAFFCWAVAAGAAGAMTLIIFAMSDPAFFADLWSIFTFRLGLTQYLPLSTRIHAVEGQLEAIQGLNAFSSALYFFEVYVVRTQAFCGSLGIAGFFALLAAVRRRGAAGDYLAAVVLPLGTCWLGWAAIMQGHYIIHEYQMILASPLLAIGVACLHSLLEETVLAMQDSWARDGVAMLTNLALPCALFFLAVSAAAVAVRGDPEAWQLANFGRRIGAEVPPGAMVVTSEMSMVQTYYAKRHIIRGVPDGTFLASRLGMMQEICPGCLLYLALRRQSAEKFRSLLDRLQPVFEDDNFIIKKISFAEREPKRVGSGGE